MKKQNALLLSIAMFAIGFSINNVAISNVGTSKIAVVDVNQVVLKSSQVQALKKEQANKTAELQKWLKNVRADIEKQGTLQDKEKAAKKYDEEFAKKKEAIAKNYKTKLQAIDKNITTAVQNTAKVQGYDIVISKSAVLYGGDDITATIAKAVK